MTQIYDSIMFCGDKIEKLFYKYGPLPPSIMIYIAYYEMPERMKWDMEAALEQLIAEKKQERTNFQDTAVDGGTLHSLSQVGDVLDMDFWMKTIGAVNKCGDEFRQLHLEYGDLSFGSNIVIYYNLLSESDIKTIERLRYLNTQVKEKQDTIIRKFKV